MIFLLFLGTPVLESVDVPSGEVEVVTAEGVNIAPNQVQICRSAPYTSVGGVPRNSEEPPAKQPRLDLDSSSTMPSPRIDESESSIHHIFQNHMMCDKLQTFGPV